MINIQLFLFLFQIRRVDVCDGTVAIPFEEGKFRVLCQQVVHDTEHKVLYFWIRQVQYQLVAVVVSLAVRQFDNPIRMFLCQFALRVDHFRLNPDTKFHTGFLCLFHQEWNAVRQFALHRLPVAQACVVVVARIFVGKPTIVQQEHVYA